MWNSWHAVFPAGCLTRHIGAYVSVACMRKLQRFRQVWHAKARSRTASLFCGKTPGDVTEANGASLPAEVARPSPASRPDASRAMDALCQRELGTLAYCVTMLCKTATDVVWSERANAGTNCRLRSWCLSASPAVVPMWPGVSRPPSYQSTDEGGHARNE